MPTLVWTTNRRWRAGARGSSARRPRFSLGRFSNTRAAPHSPHRGGLFADRSRWSGKDLKKQKKRAPIPCVAAASCVVLRPSRGSAKDSRPSLSPGVTVSRLMMFTCDGPAALFAPCANAAFCYLPDPHESRLDSGDAFDAEVAAFDCIAEPPTGR